MRSRTQNLLTNSINPYHIIIDKTGYKNKIDISFSRYDDLASYRKELQKFGLDLIETEDYVDMLILSDSPKSIEGSIK